MFFRGQGTERPINALQNLTDAHNMIIEAQVFHTCKTNNHHTRKPAISKGTLVFLSTKNLNMLKGRARKLCPKFVGPYKVLNAHPDTSTYILELPTALLSCRIVLTFHVLLLRPYHATDDNMFPNRVQPEPYDFGAPDDQEWFVEELLGHRWTNGKNLEFKVRWSL
jgi:hypothetical protein